MKYVQECKGEFNTIHRFFFNLTIKLIECNNSKFLRRNIKNVFSISKSDNTKLVQNIHYAIRHATDLKDKH